MPTVEEQMNRGDLVEQPDPPQLPDEAPEPDGPSLANRVQAMLTAETGEGSLEEYMDHPMNPTGTKWNARILRGATGMLGNLNLAVVDVIVGVVEMIWERRRAAAAAQADHGTTA